MPRRTLPLLVLLPALALAFGLGERPATAEGELDYDYYKERVAPIVARLCGECHANARERRKHGRHFLRPAPGRRVRESHHKRNYETISALIEPGNPAASLYLLKPLDARDGGLTHGGGTRLGTNTPEYGTLVDWINGATLPPVVWKPPATEPGQPDFKFYVERISPIVQTVCAECHQGKGYGKHKLLVPQPDEPFTHEQRYVNFTTILKNVIPGKPDKSRFLLKPLAEDEGGLRHRGGDKFKRDSQAYRDWVAFINGETGKPLPTGAPPPVPLLTTEGLTLQAEQFAIDAELAEVEQVGAQGTCVTAESGDGDMYIDIDVQDPGVYTLAARLTAGGPPLRWSLGQRPMAYMTDATEQATGEDGFAEVGPRVLADSLKPFEDVEGRVTIDADGHVAMDADGGTARWISPVAVEHTGAEGHVVVPDESEGFDDALLLFDMIDGLNGKVAGLTDGGRRFVVGVLEGGRLRILDSAPARPRAERKVKQIRVQYFPGLIVGFLDDRPHVRAHLNAELGTGRVGFLTHGVATVHKVAAREQFEVHIVEPREAPVVRMPAGRHRLWIEIPEGGGLLDSVRLAPTDE
ncbi:MAG: hypothetical protein QNJ98_02695 [Planctomycetota bacterium]|nr:hypothetical protein [Planctomycetota bacterium]